MEECMICLDEKEMFIFFPCNHKVCNDCFPTLVSYTNKCPLCCKIIEPFNETETEFQLVVQPVNTIPLYISRLEIVKLYCMVFICFGIITYMFSLIFNYH